ncbi:hypothetical protein BJ546DRAFT_999289 [Cryomyces antarcticus]
MPPTRLPFRILRPPRNACGRNVHSRPKIHVRSCSCSALHPTPQTRSESQLPSANLNPTASTLPNPPADHRELGIAQQLFTTSPYSPGSPLFQPNGAYVFNKLASFLRAQYPTYGFREVITPNIYKKSLWETSGHWENYADDMFSVTGRGASGQKEGAEIGEDEEFGLKPMNCPGHCLLFASEKRSYRDLPIRFADFSALHRNEVSGSLSGLTRVRRFHQDDGHIFCRPSQILQEISKTLQFVGMVYDTFSLGPYKLVLSTRPKDHYIGTSEEWDRAEGQLKQALEEQALAGRQWSINEGDGAFYGPKIDIILKDSDGKEHQTATIQLDFQLPQRFNLEYQAPAPEYERRGETTTDKALLDTSGPVTPVIVHRAILGSLERFMALLVEHYAGRWPCWLSPRPAIILTVNDDPAVTAYAEAVRIELSGRAQTPQSSSHNKALPQQPGFTELPIDIDTSARSLGRKVREAKEKKYNHIVVVGSKDVEADTVQVELQAQPDREVALTTLKQVIGVMKDQLPTEGKPLKLEMKRTQALQYLQELVKNFA